jgi:hypothetical protein
MQHEVLSFLPVLECYDSLYPAARLEYELTVTVCGRGSSHALSVICNARIVQLR